MKKLFRVLLARPQAMKLFVAAIALLAAFSGAVYALASATSEFTQTINPGTLSTDIVDGSYVSVASPSFTMAAVPFSFSCQDATGSFGTTTQQIYVKNPDASDSGWTLTLAGSAPTASWTSSSTGAHFDFNDSQTSGCGDGADTDSYKGQMTVNASGATLATGGCSSCTATNVSKGASTAFVEGTTNSITLLTAAAASDDIGDWTLKGVAVTQKIPGEQPAAADYKISLILTVTAS